MSGIVDAIQVLRSRISSSDEEGQKALKQVAEELLRRPENGLEKKLDRTIKYLTFSQKIAVGAIMRNLEGLEGQVSVKRIVTSSKTPISPSVATNSLRRLEDAGLIEAHSRGRFGTYIKVASPVIKEKLREL